MKRRGESPVEQIYKEKVEKYNKKLEVLENKIEQLKLLQEDKQSISDGLIKIKEISEEFIVKNNKIDLKSRNVLVDFINTRQYFSFERDENGKLNKVLHNGLRIRVECATY